MSEFSIIDRYCRALGVQHADTRLSVGDDAAVISVADGFELAISVDTMVEDVHFPAATSPKDIAYKLLAVNLSDMAAMGAQAKWATLALSLPAIDEAWIKAFSQSLDSAAKHYNIELIGGDTSKGKLSLSLQIMGLVRKGQALTRAGAQAGDDIYISNTLGDAALGLQYLLNPEFGDRLGSHSNKAHLVNALQRPEPRVELGQALIDIASSCIDISDGLLAELAHICQQSSTQDQSLGCDIKRELLPLSKDYQAYLKQGGDYQLALSGGDDYELCFTAPVNQAKTIEQLSQDLNIRLTRIGSVTICPEQTLQLDDEAVDNKGFQHFS